MHLSHVCSDGSTPCDDFLQPPSLRCPLPAASEAPGQSPSASPSPGWNQSRGSVHTGRSSLTGRRPSIYQHHHPPCPPLSPVGRCHSWTTPSIHNTCPPALRSNGRRLLHTLLSICQFCFFFFWSGLVCLPYHPYTLTRSFCRCKVIRRVPCFEPNSPFTFPFLPSPRRSKRVPSVSSSTHHSHCHSHPPRREREIAARCAAAAARSSRDERQRPSAARGERDGRETSGVDSETSLLHPSFAMILGQG